LLDFDRKSIELASVQPYVGFIDYAMRQKCDVIDMASHERSELSELLLGTETTKMPKPRPAFNSRDGRKFF
jgi:hypothetical protein